ncbi:MAG: GCN5-related N-acetyltransferase [Actinomycetia bacterium]|nr:GCN5-related N-acetyltransferase [Actinomycetes bacterium]
MEVRRAGPGDEEAVRSVRIAALTDAPAQFGSTLERELARDAEGWTDFVTRGALFLLERDGDSVGIAGGLPEDGDVELVSMWVGPDVRGSGGSDALVQAVIGWAGDRDVVLYAIDGNDPARHLYERNGFVATGETWTRNRDGATGFTMRRPAG